MLHINHIIVPVDFNDHSVSLGEYALDHAHAVNAAEVTFIHVTKPLPDNLDYTTPILSQLEDSLRELASEKMDAFLSKIHSEGTKCTGVVLSGEVGESIITYAKENDADLIIISTHGFQGIEKILLGSVADRVIKGAHCPVLVFNPYRGERGYDVCKPLNSCVQIV